MQLIKNTSVALKQKKKKQQTGMPDKFTSFVIIKLQFTVRRLFTSKVYANEVI